MKIHKSDIFRYYGKTKLTLKELLFMPIALRYIIIYRKINNTKSIIKFLYIFLLRVLSLLTHIQIPHQTSIGPGFYIGHFGTVIVNPKAKIGSNVNLSPGVVIGQTNRGKKKGTPIIGCNVWIGSNSVIVGSVKISDNVLIAPLSYINFSVPANSIVMGNPARIIKKSKFSTNSYINNKI